MKKDLKYVFIVGGVMSGVGKGITTASLANIFKYKGYAVSAMKIDPYINVDAGTMNPVEHGEVFVTHDGDECDQDMGNYERFLNVNLSRQNYMTTGRVYQSVIEKERALKYEGKCVQVVPHIPMEVISRINIAAEKEKAEIMFIEIGGTVGEYENLLFLEAIKMLKYKNPDNVATVMVSYLPTPFEGGEIKTKPTQHAVRALNAVGLFPDVIIARCKNSLDKIRKDKIAMMCSVPSESIISAPDVESIYDIVSNFEKDKVSEIIIKKLLLENKTNTKEKDGKNILKNPVIELANKIKKINNIKKEGSVLEKIKVNKSSVIKIGIIGKYFDSGDFVISDSYVSVIEAVKYSAYTQNVKPELTWINALDFEVANKKELESNLSKLKNYDVIIVPGGFGSRGVEGIINSIEYVRENNIPFLGICYGMQLAVVEYARNILKLADANTTEVNKKTTNKIIDIQHSQIEKLKGGDMGNSMRLGDYVCNIKDKINNKETVAHKIFKSKKIIERHRHRYEVNNDYVLALERSGMGVSGYSDSGLVEIIEINKNKYFIGIQSHPEFLARPGNTHPLFDGLIKAGLTK